MTTLMSERTDPCPVCGVPLNKARSPNTDDQWNSCPNGSANYGEHVYLPPSLKGTSVPRTSASKPDGPQSWCGLCRPKSDKNLAPCINHERMRTCSSFD